MMDSNIDMFNSKHNKTWNVENLKQILFDFMAKFNVTIHNKKMTHFSKVHDDSCIDHIFSNCYNFLTQVLTDHLDYSDHAFLHCTYKSSSQIVHPKFLFICLYHLLTKNRLTEHIVKCSDLNDIFSSTDPDFIANLLQINLNSIVNIISPLKKVMYKNDFIKYYDDKIRKDLKIQQHFLDIAIKSGLPDDWRNFKNNLLNEIKIK